MTASALIRRAHELRAWPRPREQLAQRQHRRVGGERVELARSARASAPSRACARSGATLMRSGGDARVLQRSASSAARVPAQVSVADARGERLEVGVPDPGDVAPVGDLVVEDRRARRARRSLRAEQAQHLVGAGRVLDQQDRELDARRARSRSPRPNTARGAPRPAAIVSGATPSAVASAAAASAL